MKGVQCYELFGGIALKNHALKKNVILIELNQHFTFVNVEAIDIFRFVLVKLFK